VADDKTPERPAPQVHPYDPAWRGRGVALADEISARLGALALRVEHVGSTAIPGMASKAIIDLQVSVEDLDTAAAAFDESLTMLGFARRPFDRDHVPAGRPDDRQAWAKRFWARPQPHLEPANLHVRTAGAANERLALLFRDWFRAHPQAVAAYGQFKFMLAGVVEDIDTYAEVKDPVVDVIIVAAEDWATASAWMP
jgi:GrpB-like predicted nucleotidyltransferase (UPF0157 family)